MSASSVHDVPIFFAFHSKIALRKVFGEIARWAFWTRISLHSSRDGRRPIVAWNVSRILPTVRYYWHSNFRRQHWPHDHSRLHPVNNYLEVPRQTWCLLIQRKTHVKNVTDRFNRMTVQVIWCIHEKFEDLYSDCAACRLSTKMPQQQQRIQQSIYHVLSRTLKTHILNSNSN